MTGRLAAAVLTAAVTFAIPHPLHALKPETFASSSRLASGKWMRVTVEESGMHFISNSALRQMGFNDPAAVNVYGFGGRMLPERLTDGMTDDLPPAPAIHTEDGIVFFAVDNFSWTTSPQGLDHRLNPWATESHYFLSDTGEAPTMKEITGPNGVSLTQTTFKECLAHETESTTPGESGRELWGEELRPGATKNFSFDLPDCVSDSVYVTVKVGSVIYGGQSSLSFTANGENLKAIYSDRLSSISNSTGNYIMTQARGITHKAAPKNGKLDLGIRLNTTGTYSGAWLDYIDVNYERRLRLHNGELRFHSTADRAVRMSLSGATQETQVWDVTDLMDPRRVVFTREGDVITFATQPGMHEYVAFNPSQVKRAPKSPTAVDNQDIHGMETPDMVIVTPTEYMSAARKLADYHRQKEGMTVHIIEPEKFYNEFASGCTDLTAIRRAFKMWYDRDPSKFRYALMMGKPTYDNRQLTAKVKQQNIARTPIWQSEGQFGESSSYSTDFYYGMMGDKYNQQGFDITNEKIHIAVGRFPVKSALEAEQMVDKTIAYMTSTDFGSWRNDVLLLADDGNTAHHMNQTEKCIREFKGNGNGSSFFYDRIYIDTYERKQGSAGITYPGARARLLSRLNDGVGLLNYIGHGNPKCWTHENVFTWTDINGLSNRRLPFLLAYTCEFMKWDADEVSGGEVMWLHPNSGVAGMLCPSRTVYIQNNGYFSPLIAKYFFRTNPDGSPRAIGDILLDALDELKDTQRVQKKDSTDNSSNPLKYGLLADPAMKVFNPSIRAEVRTIAGVDLTDPNAEFPEIGARGKATVTGVIKLPDGTTAENFNGELDITLYDAEVSVTSAGNGDGGTSYTFNDRNKRLFTGKVKVTGGEWSATLMLPSEITDNYSPALINLYAVSDDGREANGSCEKLYVYGYDDSSDDSEGPEISRFVINTDNFRNGDRIAPSGIVMADFYDPSGINTADTGIGHRLSLTLDGTRHFDDVNQYFTPDIEREGSGSIAYPLNGLEAGEHTLTLTVWDNANNSSSAEITFQVAVGVNPTIYDLRTDCSPARTSVVFTVSADRPLGDLSRCTIDVLDLNGRTVWSSRADSATGTGSDINIGWNLTDNSGMRVPRGIYLYRATITTTDGMTQTQTRKLAVAAQ